MSLVITALIVLLGDQLLKYAVFKFVENPTYIFGFLRLTHVANPGVAFGIGKNIESATFGKYLFVFLSLAIIVALMILFGRYCRKRLWARISLGLIVGGAVSNLFDRMMFGHVRDFIDFTFWWTFNAADLAICAGVIVLIAGIFTEEKERKSLRAAASPRENAPPEPQS